VTAAWRLPGAPASWQGTRCPPGLAAGTCRRPVRGNSSSRGAQCSTECRTQFGAQCGTQSRT
jgi:hypothetical protein